MIINVLEARAEKLAGLLGLTTGDVLRALDAGCLSLIPDYDGHARKLLKDLDE